MINNNDQAHIKALKKEYESLIDGKESLLKILKETELPELVYNSNAIENSTLTLKETEKILLEQEVMRDVSVRELFEAKNLARVLDYLESKPKLELSAENILLLHKMLIGGIDDAIAGRLRKEHEYVRVGNHIAPAPEHVEQLLNNLIDNFNSNHDLYYLDNIAYFHVEFERIHPFCDGNGRIGRVLINLQLASLGYPPLIIRNKGKHSNYYPVFQEYTDRGVYSGMSDLLVLALSESLHKRLAYMKGLNIITLSEFSKQNNLALNGQLNSAKRQTIPAFREKGVWKIGITLT
ncbi:Fic family protein [Candidatus Saccharibacteria bacterium]|nr:Fic family protein [Candidatus Saccharibacteria bacterium]